jgi:hypothetical protein
MSAATHTGPHSPPQSPGTHGHYLTAQLVDHRNMMGLAMGIDATDDNPNLTGHARHRCTSPRSHWMGQRVAVGRDGQDSDGCLSHRGAIRSRRPAAHADDTARAEVDQSWPRQQHRVSRRRVTPLTSGAAHITSHCRRDATRTSACKIDSWAVVGPSDVEKY